MWILGNIVEAPQEKRIDYTKLENLEDAPPSILGNIVERKYSIDDIKNIKYNVPYLSTGFAPIIRIDDEALLTEEVCFYQIYLLTFRSEK